MERWKSKSRNPKNKKEIPKATETVSSSSAPPPSWIELPEDVTANILQRLGAEEILESAQKVCTTWRKVCQDPAMWRVIDLKSTGVSEETYNLICRCAVDRSQGQLIELRISGFGDDELLNYIVNRSSHLQRLTLANCYDISETALTEEVKRLPQLEELHLITMSLIRAKDVDTIGISCPMLKSFTFNVHWCDHQEFSEDDELTEDQCCNQYALAIGKNMPNLRHLQLIAHWMKNEGLEAILDGCPHLESLDIRQCFGLDLQGALGKRCSQQIKDLRFPGDSISDFEWPANNESSDVEWDDDQSYSGFSDSSFGSFGDGDYDCYCEDFDDYDYDYFF